MSKEQFAFLVSPRALVGKRSGSRTYLVQMFGRAGTNFGRDALRRLLERVPLVSANNVKRAIRFPGPPQRPALQAYLAHKKQPPPLGPP